MEILSCNWVRTHWRITLIRMSEIDIDMKKVADRYLKREVLGEGTYGVVYKAIDTQVLHLPENL